MKCVELKENGVVFETERGDDLSRVMCFVNDWAKRFTNYDNFAVISYKVNVNYSVSPREAYRLVVNFTSKDDNDNYYVEASENGFKIINNATFNLQGLISNVALFKSLVKNIKSYTIVHEEETLVDAISFEFNF